MWMTARSIYTAVFTFFISGCSVGIATDQKQKIAASVPRPMECVTGINLRKTCAFVFFVFLFYAYILLQSNFQRRIFWILVWKVLAVGPALNVGHSETQ